MKNLEPQRQRGRCTNSVRNKRYATNHKLNLVKSFATPMRADNLGLWQTTLQWPCGEELSFELRRKMSDITALRALLTFSGTRFDSRTMSAMPFLISSASARLSAFAQASEAFPTEFNKRRGAEDASFAFEPRLLERAFATPAALPCLPMLSFDSDPWPTRELQSGAETTLETMMATSSHRRWRPETTGIPPGKSGKGELAR